MPKIKDTDDVDLDNLLPGGDDADNGADDQQDDQQDDSDDQEGDDDQAGDGEGDDDQGGADEQDAGAGRRPEDQGTPRRASRENDRVRTLNDELKAEREERKALQARFDEFARRPAVNAAPVESQDQRNARRALLSETERLAEDQREFQQQMTRQMGQTQFALQDQSDKSLFEAKAVANPVYQRWAPKVEAELTRLRAQGTNVAREAILRYMIGDAALASHAGKGGKTAKAEGRRRVDRQSTKPNDTRNDASRSNQRGGRSLEERLANVPL